jgi:hypothetical protein
MHRFAALLMTCMVCLATFSAQAAEAEAPLATSNGGTVISVRALDDPQNPYLGRYSDYDRWVYEHSMPLPSDLASSPDHGTAYMQELMAKQPPGSVRGGGSVTDEGWLVPASLQPRLRFKGEQAASPREYINGGDVLQDPAPGHKYHLFALGPQSEAVRLSQQMDYYAEKASQYPRIPAWLGQHSPLLAVFVPNGDILTYGELDLHIASDMPFFSPAAAPGETWSRGR